MIITWPKHDRTNHGYRHDNSHDDDRDDNSRDDDYLNDMNNMTITWSYYHRIITIMITIIIIMIILLSSWP